MLSGERTRFKRVVSKRLGLDGGSSSSSKADKKKRETEERRENKGEGEASAIGGDGDVVENDQQQPVLISVGGFKAVDNSVAVTREVADFCRVVRAVKKAAAANAAGIAAGYGDAATEGEKGGGGSSMLARAGLFEPAFLLILHSLEVTLDEMRDSRRRFFSVVPTCTARPNPFCCRNCTPHDCCGASCLDVLFRAVLKHV